MAKDAVRVFISYSHRDELLRDSLATHLSNLQWQGIISSWYDRQLTAGMEWDNKIKTELESADLILLLISPDFIASKYCRDVEIPMALQRHESKQAYVVPIILRPFDWSDAPFAKLQAFPKDAKAVTTWANQDEAFVSVTQGIRTAAKLMLDYRKQHVEQQQVIQAQYLQKVEEVLSDGVISIVERDTLDELRETLGLTPEEAKEIETRAYEPYSRVEENLNKYKQTLNRLIEKGYYPFSEEIGKDLENRQRDLGLKPEDATRVSKPILGQAELDYQAKKKQLAEAESLQKLDRQQQLDQKGYKANPERYKQEFPSAVQIDCPPNRHLISDEIGQEVTRDSSVTELRTTLLTDCPLKVPVEVETPVRPSSNILTQEAQLKLETQEFCSEDEIVFNLINRLFDILSSSNAETAIQNFEAVAHQSLLQNGQIDPVFRKNSFSVAVARLSLYRRPIEIVRSEPTGRTKLGSRGNKENGKEKKYAIARKENLGGFEGHIRIFFPANGSMIKISGLNL